MENKEECIIHLEAIRVSMHIFFYDILHTLIKDLQKYADDLDKDYKDIKISKIAGQSGCVVGGVLTVVGFGLSFATFGASLGLCIAGGVIAGAGGITSGGASVADYVKGKDTRKKAEDQLEFCNRQIRKLLENCKSTSDKLERVEDIDKRFPFWREFWGKFMFGSSKVATGLGWKMVASTVISAIRLDVAADITSAVVPVFRALGNTAKVFHIAGGVVSAVFLPLDVYSLVSNSVELHTNEAHGESKRIRQAVSEIQDKCPKKEEIDGMIDKCIAALY